MTQERMAPITTGGSSESVLLPEDADSIPVIPLTYGYARVSKADDDSKNLETQLRELDAHGIRRDLVFTDEANGRTMDRPGWQDLMSRVQPGDTIVVAFLDRFSRNFEEGVAIQADLTRRDIAIVAIREQIDNRESSAAANFFRRAMLAQGAYQVESASVRMAAEGAGLRQIARALKCSPATVRKALLAENGHVPGPAAAQDLGE